MRLSVQHTETVSYEPASMGTIEVARMTPRDHQGHYVCDWSVEVDADCKVSETSDAFGNKITSFSLLGPLEAVTIHAEGEIETDAHHGVVKGTINKVPQGVFLRPGLPDSQASLARQLASLVNADGAIQDTPLSHMHALMAMLNASISRMSDPDDNDEAASQQMQSQQHQEAQSSQKAPDTPVDDLSERADVQRMTASLMGQNISDAADVALVLCDSARIAGLPARLISGYRLLDGKVQTHEHRQVWAEIYIEDLGWVGFDPQTNSCPSEESVRVAIGLDRHGIKPLRIGHYGSVGEVERTTNIALKRISG